MPARPVRRDEMSGLAWALKIHLMRWFERDKERERFYLLPGMGGRARRQKEMRYLRWSIAAALLVSAVVAAILYFISRS
jgi:hypothetical protein